MSGLDARAKPPELLRALFKRFRQCSRSTVENDPEVIDICKGIGGQQENGICSSDYYIEQSSVRRAFRGFLGTDHEDETSDTQTSAPKARLHAYRFKQVPGLVILPSLLTEPIQLELLNRLLHRDLSDARHTTNIHFHHDVDYPFACRSFFSLDPTDATVLAPKDSETHKPISVRSMLNKKLRWLLLGGQYDWTKKEYPETDPPSFPEDIARLVHALFPEMSAEAAIVNLYSPGDTLSLHRDVSEECANGLVSISLGCDALFVVGLEDKPGVVLRLHSGDAVLMSGESRYAWHGVPSILTDTCPPGLVQWPESTPRKGDSGDGDYGTIHPGWAGWMATKRVNLNIRQMWPS